MRHAIVVGWWHLVAVLALGTREMAFAADGSPATVNPGTLLDSLPAVVLAVGALGTAAFGIVDGLKLIPWVDLAGFERLFSRKASQDARRWVFTIRANLDPLVPALVLAYGNNVLEVLKAQYRSGRGKGDLPRTLRQGVRIGLGFMDGPGIAQLALGLGLPESTADDVANALVVTRTLRPSAHGEPPAPAVPTSPITGEERSAIARLETAIDARIDAALVLAETMYVTQTKLAASVVALAVAFLVGRLGMNVSWPIWLLVGLAAVPLAPVAHDVAAAVQEATKAFRAVRAR